jgi:hypothetical protein
MNHLQFLGLVTMRQQLQSLLMDNRSGVYFFWLFWSKLSTCCDLAKSFFTDTVVGEGGVGWWANQLLCHSQLELSWAGTINATLTSQAMFGELIGDQSRRVVTDQSNQELLSN